MRKIDKNKTEKYLETAHIPSIDKVKKSTVKKNVWLKLQSPQEVKPKRSFFHYQYILYAFLGVFIAFSVTFLLGQFKNTKDFDVSKNYIKVAEQRDAVSINNDKELVNIIQDTYTSLGGKPGDIKKTDEYKRLENSINNVNKGLYRESIIEYTKDYKDILDALDYSDDYINEVLAVPTYVYTWVTPSYYKNFTKQNGKIIDYYLSTPQYATQYSGSKYAINAKLPESEYFYGYSRFSPIGEQLILYHDVSSGNAKKGESKTVNGKEIQGYKLSDSSNPFSKEQGLPTYKVYYLDSSMNLVLKEEFLKSNNKLVLTQKYEDLYEYDINDENINSIFNNRELNEIEMKNYNGQSKKPHLKSLDELRGLTNIYYFPGLENTLRHSDMDYDEYFLLSNDKDFLGDKRTSKDLRIGGYYQKDSKAWQVVVTDIYDKKPEINIGIPQSIIVEKEIEIELDNKVIKATYYEVMAIPQNGGLKGDQLRQAYNFPGRFYYLLFQSNGKWYLMGEVQSEDPKEAIKSQHIKEENISLKSLDSKSAKKQDEIYQNL